MILLVALIEYVNGRPPPPFGYHARFGGRFGGRYGRFTTPQPRAALTCIEVLDKIDPPEDYTTKKQKKCRADRCKDFITVEHIIREYNEEPYGNKEEEEELRSKAEKDIAKALNRKRKNKCRNPVAQSYSYFGK